MSTKTETKNIRQRYLFLKQTSKWMLFQSGVYPTLKYNEILVFRSDRIELNLTIDQAILLLKRFYLLLRDKKIHHTRKKAMEIFISEFEKDLERHNETVKNNHSHFILENEFSSWICRVCKERICTRCLNVLSTSDDLYHFLECEF